MAAASVNASQGDHRFMTGVAGLDFANTLVWRNDAARREDRIPTLGHARAWALACRLPVAPHETLDALIAAREAIDGLFRSAAAGIPVSECWAELLGLCSGAAKDEDLVVSARGLAPAAPSSLSGALLHSALALALSAEAGRVKVCGNCGWLFVDRTRNGNKRWCISALCGNRVKARRHYARKRAGR